MPYSINPFRPVSIQVQLNPSHWSTRQLISSKTLYYQCQSGHDLPLYYQCQSGHDLSLYYQCQSGQNLSLY